jgi:hypothetical protein
MDFMIPTTITVMVLHIKKTKSTSGKLDFTANLRVACSANLPDRLEFGVSVFPNQQFPLSGFRDAKQQFPL